MLVAREAVRYRRGQREGPEHAAGQAGARGADATASTTSSAAPPCSTCSACASRTGSSSRCGTPSTSASVDIIYDETLDPGGPGRATTTSAGALVDMIQSHLLQVMALLAMDPPLHARRSRPARSQGRGASRDAGSGATTRPESRRRPATPPAPSTAGRLPDYVDEPGVDPHATPRRSRRSSWRSTTGGGPGCRSGCARARRIGAARKEIVVTFKPAPHVPDRAHGEVDARPAAADAGPGRHGAGGERQRPRTTRSTIDRVSLDADLSPGRLPAYGEVLAGMLDGDPLLVGARRHRGRLLAHRRPRPGDVAGGRDPARVLLRRLAGTRGLAGLKDPAPTRRIGFRGDGLPDDGAGNHR